MASTAGPTRGTKRAGVGLVATVGVEEEFLLLRPNGDVACIAPDVLRTLADDSYVKPEFMRFQVESTSGVCSALPTLISDLVRERRSLARVALSHGARLVASATPPYGFPGAAALTDSSRYRRLSEQFPSLAGHEVSCGCHVHVGVATRDLGVAVLRRIRGWLPLLLALNGNSPMWLNRDSGWESYRYAVQSEWPTAEIPPPFADGAMYDAIVAERISAGDALDASSVYYFARLSPCYPTVEIRIADTCLTVAEAVLHAAICRALVATAIDDAEAGRACFDVPDHLLSASAGAAAHRGLDALLVDPRSGDLRPGRELLHMLVRHVAPALEAAGDLRVVTALLAHRLRRGSGAARQRTLRRTHDRAGFVQALSEATVVVDGLT